MPRKDDQLNVRPSELKAALARIAKAEDRSVAYVVERISRSTWREGWV